MKKLIIILTIIFLLPQNIYALDYPKTDSEIIEVYDMTDNKVLYETDADKVSQIASLTKIAAVITAIEDIRNIDEKVKITGSILSTVDSDSSVAGLKAGDVLTYRDLLYASILPSGADATNSIAVLSSGSISSFVKKMNDIAKKLGLKNTNFANVTGLYDKNHYSTADDMRKILAYSLKNPLFKQIYTTKEYRLSNGLLVKTTLYTYNVSASENKKILGSKTGYTKEAGYCLSSLSNINGHEVVIISLKARNDGNVYYHVEDTSKLIDFLNDNYKEQLLVKKGELIKGIPVNLSNMEWYYINSPSDVTKFLPNDYSKDGLHIEYEGLDKLSFKNKQGEKIGTVNYYYDDELFFSQDIILDKKIDFSIIKFIKRYFYILIVAVMILLFIIKRRKVIYG